MFLIINLILEELQGEKMKIILKTVDK